MGTNMKAVSRGCVFHLIEETLPACLLPDAGLLVVRESQLEVASSVASLSVGSVMIPSGLSGVPQKPADLVDAVGSPQPVDMEKEVIQINVRIVAMTSDRRCQSHRRASVRAQQELLHQPVQLPAVAMHDVRASPRPEGMT
jgi:hypothetical protein